MKKLIYTAICMSLLCAIICVSGASAQRVCNPQTDCCPLFDYTLMASTEVTGLTGIEADFTVPDTPNGEMKIPVWGVFPFIEPVIDENEPRYGIFQPVLEWDYSYKTKQWTITPWYEEHLGTKSCGYRNKEQNYCTCTPEQEQLGNPAATKLYRMDVPQCHKMCNPKHGQRITASQGDRIHFAIINTGGTWATTAHNTNTNQQTSFQTTCIQPQDKLKVGFALENSAGDPLNKHNKDGLQFPGNIEFTNIKFAGNTGTVKLKPTVDPTAKACFPWLDIHINNGWIGYGSTNTVTFITQPEKKDVSHKNGADL